jgi:hypothetical protein
MALFAAGAEPLLPPPAQPSVASCAQWAQATGANDEWGEIRVQLRDAKVEAREAWETRHSQVCALAGVCWCAVCHACVLLCPLVN